MSSPGGGEARPASERAPTPSSAAAAAPASSQQRRQQQPQPVAQSISFAGDEAHASRLVRARNVVVRSACGAHGDGSSRVKFRDIVDFNWGGGGGAEATGGGWRLLAVHPRGEYLAYAVRPPASAAAVVRVVERATNARALVRGARGHVHDLAFAHTERRALLASADETGGVRVHAVERAEGDARALRTTQLLHVQLPREPGAEHRRVVWCSYIPDDDDDEEEEAAGVDTERESAELLLATEGDKAYVWNVGHVVARFGSAEALAPAQMGGHCHLLREHTQPIVDAVYSPDGTLLATASLDGFVMFFQIYVNVSAETPRCLQKWSPHDGKPLSSISFLDDRHKETQQFWKYVVTGAEKNSVLKVWSCKSWECLQTIIFTPSPNYPNIALRVGLDQSAKYLLLSDIHRRALYILHFDNDGDESAPVTCKKISEFHLPSSILCFGIVDARLKRMKRSSIGSDGYDENGSCQSPDESLDEFNENENDDMGSESDLVSNGHDANDEDNMRAVVRLYLIQPNRLQEGLVTFAPYKPNSSMDKTINLIPNDSLDFKDEKAEKNADSTIIVTSPQKVSPFDDKEEGSDRQTHLSCVLSQQSEQLKSLLMRNPPTSPSASAGMTNVSSFVPLVATANVGTSFHAPLNLMTPDAFSSAKHEESSVLASPDVRLPSNASIDDPIENEKAFNSNRQTSTIADAKFASGGSSPSREVQEILSVKGSDCFYEDSINEEDFYSPKINHMINSAGLSTGTAETNSTVWPSIDLSNLKDANKRKSNTDISEKSGNIIDLADTDKTSNLPVDNLEKASGAPYSPNSSSEMKTVISKLDRLTNLVYDQQKEMLVLKNEMATLRRIYQNNIAQSGIEEPTQVPKMIEQALMSNHVQLKKLIDSAIDSRAETERIHRETLLSGVSQILGAQLGEKLNACVAHETRTTILPLMQRLIDPFTRSLHMEVTQKLTATDHLLAENIQKMVNNKTVIENLSQSLSSSVTNSTKEAFKQSIQTSLIPHLEKALNQMFKQLNQSFSLGTKEYLSAFDGCTKRTLEHIGNADETLVKAKAVASLLQSIVDQQNKTNNNLQTQQGSKQLQHISKDIQNTISNTLQGALEDHLTPIKECIKEQIISGMAAQAALLEDSVRSAVRSGTQTPALGVIDVQVQQHHVEHLLKSGQTNAAFQYALSASDLKLVTYACTLADPRQVFCVPCPLQPNVLLSLIQQLSADMTSDTELKCSYLGEAIMYLSADQENPLTKEHMPMVLKELQRQISQFLAQNRSNSCAQQLRLLLLATESLIKS